MVEKKSEKKLAELLGNDKLDTGCQIAHGESIGLGSSDYELIEID
jgi:uncharacterized Fe-S center protein